MKIVVLKENEAAPRVVEAKEITLELLQKEVGGYIEEAPKPRAGGNDILAGNSCSVWCDEDGILKRRMPNIFWDSISEGLQSLVGNIVVTGNSGPDITPLKDGAIPQVMKALKGRRFIIDSFRKAWKEEFGEKPKIIKGPWKDNSIRGYNGEGTRALVKYKGNTYLVDVRWTADHGNEGFIEKVRVKKSGELWRCSSDNEVIPLSHDGEKGLYEFLERFDWEAWERRMKE